MVSDKTLLNYPDWNINFTEHTDASDKQFVAIISHNNKPIAFDRFQLNIYTLLSFSGAQKK